VREYDFSDDSDDFLKHRPRRSKVQPRRRGRLTEHERTVLAELREDATSHDDRPPNGERWSTWDRAMHGPDPRPDWVITDLAAEDTDLGVLKTGKEADVFLVRRAVGVDGPAVVMAAKRYRSADHRLFHRDAQYLEGRRMRKSRENRAMASRSSYGRNLIAEQWTIAEFGALCRLWAAGVAVPYPVQLEGTELLMEFVGDADGVAAPRLAELRPEGEHLRHLWRELLALLAALAREGLAHGDLSAYNMLVADDTLVLIDLPQVVDLTINPAGQEFLARDVRNVANWFAARGLAPDVVDAGEVTAMLLAEAGLD
jgi:RIO kinase 1